MSGANYGIVFLYIGIAIIAATALALAGCWWWLGSLGSAIGFVSAIGLVLVGITTSLINFGSGLKNHIGAFLLGSAMYLVLIGLTSSLFWLTIEAGILTALALLAQAFSFYSIMQFANRPLIWWGLFLSLWAGMVWADALWLAWPIFGLMLGFYTMMRKFMPVYLFTVKYPSVYYWLNKNLGLSGWRRLISSQQGLKLDFLNAYIDKKINHIYSQEPVETAMEQAFWEKLQENELSLGDAQGLSDQFRLHLLFLDPHFIPKWAALSGKNAIIRKDLEQFGSHCQDLLGQFINDPNSFDPSLLAAKGVENQIDKLLEQVPEELEQLRAAIGLFYPAIGIARNIDPNLPIY